MATAARSRAFYAINITLCRAERTTDHIYAIFRKDGTNVLLISGSGQAIANWPAEVSGNVGALKIGDGKAPMTLSIQQVAARTNVEVPGTALVEVGCQNQFQRLAVNTLQD